LQYIEEITEVIGGPVISDRVTNLRNARRRGAPSTKLEESDAPIYVMAYDTLTDEVRYGPKRELKPGIKDRYAAIRDEHKLGDENLHSLAERVGARLYQADPKAGATKPFAEIAAELSQQYSLGTIQRNRDRPTTSRDKVRVTDLD